MKKLKFKNYEKIKYKIYYLLGFLDIRNFNIYNSCEFSGDFLILEFIEEDYNFYGILFKTLFIENFVE